MDGIYAAVVAWFGTLEALILSIFSAFTLSQ